MTAIGLPAENLRQPFDILMLLRSTQMQQAGQEGITHNAQTVNVFQRRWRQVHKATIVHSPD